MSLLKIYRIHEDAILPKFATQESACFDVSCYLKTATDICVNTHWGDKRFYSFPETKQDFFIRLHPKEWTLLPTGLKFDIPRGYSVRLHPRSGLALKHGITLLNAEGIIDSDYIHEVKVILINNGNDVFTINHGDRICQGELIKNLEYTIEEIDDCPIDKSDRTGGFGSTGV